MRTQGILYPGKGTVYVSEMETCPTCGGAMETAYTSKYKIVQSMREVMMIAQRTKRCINRDCLGASVIWGSVEWGQIAPVYCGYGYDVIAQIGWLRQTMRQPFASIHADLRKRVRISASEVRALYHYRYLALLACHERQQEEHLKVLSERSGLVLSLDGLAPEGGEPQLWLVRELTSGLTLRSGWMSQQDEGAFVRFLQPIADLGLRVTAVMSDKQRGLLPAVAKVFPDAKHAFCQIHYLRNMAIPAAEADESMKIGLRKDVRAAVGEYICQEQVEAAGVLTVTGIVPSPIEVPSVVAPADFPQKAEQVRDAVTRDICRRIRYLLTLKGRPPFRLAGIEMFERLSEVEECLEHLIAHHPTPQLSALQLGLQTALQTSQPRYTTLRQAADWLEHITDLLDPDDKPLRSGDQVRQDLLDFMDAIALTTLNDPFLLAFFKTIQKTTCHYAPGLFHCYDIPGLPRTNNDRESDFRDLTRRLLRTTGQNGLSKRIIQREGAWELLSHPDTLDETIRVVSHIPFSDFLLERLRIRQHRARFRLHSRSANKSRSQLDRLEHLWFDTPPGVP
jgi:hypothetical protein